MTTRHVLAAFIISVLLATGTAAASPGNMTVSVNLNTTSGTVYVPGSGSMPAGQQSGMVDSPGHFYIASYINGILYGLVFAYQQPLYVMTLPFTGGHTIRMATESENSKVFLAFTRGDWSVIEERMPLIELGTFFGYMYPSFGYGLGKNNDVKILLDYGNVYELDSQLILNPGSHSLSVEHVGEQGGKQVIVIRRA